MTKKLTIISLIGITIIIGSVSGCEDVKTEEYGLDKVVGSDILKTEEYIFKDFDRLDISHAFEVSITQSDSYNISITADDNIFSYIRVTSEDKTLKMNLISVDKLVPLNLKAKISMPEIQSIKLSEATHGTLSKFHSTDNLYIELSNGGRIEFIDVSVRDATFDVSFASEVNGQIVARDVNFNISEASIVELTGSADNVVVDSYRVCTIKLAEFSVHNANVRLSGISSGMIQLDGRLDATLSDSSNLEYIGEPLMGTIIVSDTSTLSKIEN